MKKQIFLTLALALGISPVAQAGNDKPSGALAVLGGAVALSALGAAYGNERHREDSSLVKNTLTLGAIGGLYGAVACSSNRTQGAAAYAMIAGTGAVAGYVAHSEPVIGTLEAAKPLSNMFLDDPIEDSSGKKHVAAGCGSTYRSIVTYLALSATVYPAFSWLTQVSINDYLINR